MPPRTILRFLLIVALGAGCALVSCGGRTGIRVESAPVFDPPAPRLEFRSPIPASAPKRIVSLIPSVTECLFALGLGDRVVGIDRWSDFPPESQALPRLGDLNGIDVEKIIDLKPDLVVLMSAHEVAAGLLRKAGLRVEVPPTEAGADVLAGIVQVAAAAGVRERGVELVEHVRSKVETVRAAHRDKQQRPGVLILFERQPTFSVCTRSSFVHGMIEAAGGRNLSADVDAVKHFAYVPLEKIIDWKPDLVIDLTAGLDQSGDTKSSEAFWRKHVPLDSRVVLLPSPVFARPGPRMGAAVERLAELIHGR